jgi:hypothetical protein
LNLRFRVSLRHSSSVLCALAVSCAGGAWSQDLTAARACARITGAAARLACYDNAFAASPAPAPPTRAASPAPAAAPAQAAAPAAGPDIAQFGDKGQLQPEHKPKAALPKTLIAKVQSAAPLGRGLYRLTLENGQIWETRQADWALDFKSGDMVTISRMLLDNYQISLGGQGRSIGVRRIK